MKATPQRESPFSTFSPLLSLGGGLILGLSFLPGPLWGLSGVALVPLLLVWDATERVARFLAETFTAFLLAYAIGFFWPLLHHVEDTASLAIGSLFVIPLLWTLPFGLSLPFRRRYGRGAGLAALVIFFLAAEMLLLIGPVPFPWPILGHTQASALPLIQFVAWTGELGLTLWVLVINSLLFLLIAPQQRQQRLLAAFALALLLAGSAMTSWWHRNHEAEETHYVTMGLIQPALSQEAWTAEYGAVRLRRLTAMSDSLIAAMNAPPVFMIWPEMAIPVPPNEARATYVANALRAWTDRQQIALLAGALTRTSSTRFNNSALLLRPFDDSLRYDQVHRPPYDTKVPVAEQAPWLAASTEARFLPGTPSPPLHFDDVRLGMAIGFDLLMSPHTRQAAQNGAEVLVALTQEGWWRRTPGIGLHLRYARLRALETHRSVVLVSASGLTSLIAPDGHLIYRSEEGAPAARLAAVPLSTRETLYVRTGNVLGWTGLALAALLLGWLLLIGLFWTVRSPEPGSPPPSPPA